MPTNYVGAKANTQAPSAQPEPEGTITAALPADGDPTNASTYAQAYKVLADFVDFLLKLQAKASAWTQHIWATRSAGGHKRFGIDHMGLPGGWIVSWIEDWSRGHALADSGGPRDINGSLLDFKNGFVGDMLALAGAALKDAAAEATWNATAQGKVDDAGDALIAAEAEYDELQANGTWLLKAVRTSGTAIVGFSDPTAAIPAHRFLYVVPGDTLNDYGMIYRRGACRFDDSLSFSLQFTLKLEAANMGTKLAAHAGFCDENAMPTSFVGTAANYAVFYVGTSGNWFAATRGSGGAVTATDTTVAPGTTEVRMRIEFWGATVADDTVRAVRFYINGTLRATHTTNLPASSALASVHFSCLNYQGGAPGLTVPVAIGPTAFGQNLFAADVF